MATKILNGHCPVLTCQQEVGVAKQISIDGRLYDEYHCPDHGLAFRKVVPPDWSYLGERKDTRMPQEWPPVKHTLVDGNYALFRTAVQHCIDIPGNRILIIGNKNHDASEFVDAIERVKYEGHGKTYQFKNGSYIIQRENGKTLKHIARGLELGGFYVEGNVSLDSELENILNTRLRLQVARNDRRVVTAMPRPTEPAKTPNTEFTPNTLDYGYRAAILTSMQTPVSPSDALSLNVKIRQYLTDFKGEERTTAPSAVERIRLNIDSIKKWLDHYQRGSEDFVNSTSRVDKHAETIKVALLHLAHWSSLDSENDWKRESAEKELDRAIKAAHDDIGDLCRDAVIKAKEAAQADLHRVVIGTNTFPTSDEDAE